MKTVEEVQREHIERLIAEKMTLEKQLAKVLSENRDLHRIIEQDNIERKRRH